MNWIKALTRREKTLATIASLTVILLFCGGVVSYMRGCASKSFGQEVDTIHSIRFVTMHKPILDSLSCVKKHIGNVEKKQEEQAKINRQIVYLILAPYSDAQQAQIQRRADEKWKADSTRMAMRGGQ
jgi:hypothetical protein